MTEHDDGAGQAHTGWTEADLDTALDALHQRPITGQPPLTSARARLFTAIAAEADPPATRRRGARWQRSRWSLAAAAAVAVLAAGALVLGNPLTGSAPTASAAALTLRQAASATITQQDTPLGPGQYRYVAEHFWSLSRSHPEDGPALAWRTESRTQTWVPHDQTDEWVRDSTETGQRDWVLGSAEQAARAGMAADPFGPPEGRTRAACGDFAAVLEHRQPSCTGQGDWKQPTSAWLATLPRDPNQLLSLLTDRAPDGAGIALGRSVLLLRSGLVPADLRAALYQALALLPELEITEQSTNLDGRQGIALGVVEQNLRRDIIIDPATGQFIGERLIQATDDDPDGLPAGTLLNSTSVTTTVVNDIG